MIFRPVSPVSAFGPPISNRPVGFTSTRRRSVVEVGELAEDRVDDLRLDVGAQERLDVDLLAVLRADQDRVDAGRDGPPRTRSTTCVFPSGRR